MCGTTMLWLIRPTCAALLTASAAACAQPAAKPADGVDVQGQWRVEQARTEPIYERGSARLDFGAGGRLSGHTSCNTLAAGYTLQGAELRIGAVTTSRMVCSRLQLEQEDRILSALEVATSARVRPDGLLELRDAAAVGVLRATRFLPGEGPQTD
jgi:heat shock protein HslJ